VYRLPVSVSACLPLLAPPAAVAVVGVGERPTVKLTMRAAHLWTRRVGLVRDGCNLALADVNVEGLAAVKEACLAARPDAVVSTHRVDMGVRSQIVRFGDEVRAAHGGTVHLLFNNAGIQIPKSWDRMTEAEYDRVMAINLDGTCMRTLAQPPLPLPVPYCLWPS
jgi:hypothetical protein